MIKITHKIRCFCGKRVLLHKTNAKIPNGMLGSERSGAHNKPNADINKKAYLNELLMVVEFYKDIIL